MRDEKLKKLFMGDDYEPKASPISEEDIMAKMQILEELRDQMAELMATKMKGDYDEMQKVTVASDDKSGLLAGLGKAEEVIEEGPETLLEEDEDEEEE